MTKRKASKGRARRISEEAAEAAKGDDGYSSFFDITPERGNGLQDADTVKRLAQLKYADPSRFLDLMDVLADRGVRQLPELQKKGRYLSEAAGACHEGKECGRSSPAQ